MNTSIVFNKSTWKSKNDTVEVFKSKHEISFQCKLGKTNKPESFQTSKEDEWCK
jgi:hypothetical protein